MALLFKSPWSFAYHVGKDLVVNGVQIYKEISAAVTDYEASQYRTFGVDTGKALAMIFLGSVQHFENTKTNLLND